jgi:hypothetical protein
MREKGVWIAFGGKILQVKANHWIGAELNGSCRGGRMQISIACHSSSRTIPVKPENKSVVSVGQAFPGDLSSGKMIRLGRKGEQKCHCCHPALSAQKHTRTSYKANDI